MVTVHPMVTHYQSEQGVLVAKSVVGVTEVLAHSFPTTSEFFLGLRPHGHGSRWGTERGRVTALAVR